MSTYTGDWTVFQQDFALAHQTWSSIGKLDHLGIGLETVNPDNNQPFTESELTERFELITQNGIQEIDIWSTPIPENWWPHIEKFVNS
jgi:hypothetical protein